MEIPEKDVRSLFEGILRGDGDAFSRMASSHEGGENCYPFPIKGIVNTFNEMMTAGFEFSEQDIQEQVDGAIARVKQYLKLV